MVFDLCINHAFILSVLCQWSAHSCISCHQRLPIIADGWLQQKLRFWISSHVQSVVCSHISDRSIMSSGILGFLMRGLLIPRWQMFNQQQTAESGMLKTGIFQPHWFPLHLKTFIYHTAHIMSMGNMSYEWIWRKASEQLLWKFSSLHPESKNTNPKPLHSVERLRIWNSSSFDGVLWSAYERCLSEIFLSILLH